MKTIIANWKLNPTAINEADELVGFLAGERNKEPFKSSLIFCPPFLYLPELVKKYRSEIYGAQNCFWEEKGAFTGEISATMVKNAGGKYVILGHSERRKYMAETDEVVNKKLASVLKSGLQAVVCVGERTRQGVSEAEYLKVIEDQVRGSLDGVSKEEFGNIIVAYEPVWAIGTGVSDSPPESLKSITHIRKAVSAMLNDNVVGEAVKVLYGGSVNGANAEGFLKEPGISGALVGGASLKKEEFLGIIRTADKYNQ
jgi:triosephosphate isomerase